jgi:HD-GYP domain-containing protein (c-di-GMP phosphodiesterase class II)
MIGTVVHAALALHFDQSNAGFFLLMPAMYTAVFFWHDKPVATFCTAMYTISFVAIPLMVGGTDEISRVITTTPIFLALVLTTGFLGSESHQMSQKRGRFESTISSLLVALQERDGYTADHSEETVDLAMAVGDELRISDDQRSVLADVALLHDIGKIGIPNEILNKRSGLDDHEWEFMKKHPEIGERIVAPVPGFAPVAKAIRHEHERWDGAGYPDGISGEEIPLSSRVVLVCDAFHAMITDRPYRKSIGMEQARAEMVRHAGTQFDPAVVDALLAVIDAGAIPDSVGQAAWDGATNMPQDIQSAIA